MDKQYSSNYMQSTFDKAFVEVAKYLIEHKRHINKFSTQKELSVKLNLTQGTFVEIKKGNRGVPKKKIKPISKILIEEFGVNDVYLISGKGNIIRQSLDEPDIKFDKLKIDNSIEKINDELERLSEQIEHKNILIAEKNRFIEVLSEKIRELNKLLDK